MTHQEIVEQFDFSGSVGEVIPFGGGHIHDTFLVKNASPSHPDYILQQINHRVFQNVDGLMQNMELVTQHLRQKLAQKGVEDVSSQSIGLIKTPHGELYFADGSGSCWRMMNAIPSSRVYEKAPDPEIAYEGARKFGEFVSLLSDLPPQKLVETIPDFHNVKKRYETFAKTLKEDPKNRATLAEEEIAYLKDQFDWVAQIQHLKEQGALPLRVTHNDTKINNVLFDDANKAICVVDLDTTMPGLIHYDYGDGIRSCANTGAEDEEDLKNVSLDLEMFESFSRGFIETTYHLLNETEQKTLVHAAILFPYLMGLRFLTDYIQGDVYYKTDYADHNLARARAQLKLVKDGREKFYEMNRILMHIFSTT